MRSMSVRFLAICILVFMPSSLSLGQQPDIFDLRSDELQQDDRSVDTPDSLFDLIPPRQFEFNQLESASTPDKADIASQQKEQDQQLIFGEDEEEEDLISVNFENVDIRDVIRILANKAQKNIVVGPDISANVNIQLSGVTWDRALNVILSTYGLTYKEEEGLMRIMTLDQLQSEEEKIPLETEIITLNFARGSEIKSNFENILGPRGRIDVNDRTNSLIITDIPDNIKKIKEIAYKLDTRTPQVLIEVLIADVKISQDDQLGIEWDMAWPDLPTGAPQRTLRQEFAGTPAKGIIFNFGTTMLTDKDLNATIAAWQQQSRVNILAHPKILTLDNLTATIALTEEIPYTQTQQSTDGVAALTSTAFKSSGINLSVTPHITRKDKFIYLALSVSQSFNSGFTSDNQPIIDTRSAATNLLVKDKQTAVIGGLRKKDDTFAINKVPFLGDIPILGAIFRKRTEQISDTDLMIFVTPTIIEDAELSPKELDRLELFEEETEDWAYQFDAIRKKKLRRKRAARRTRAISKTRLGLKEEKILPRESVYLRPPLLTEEDL